MDVGLQLDYASVVSTQACPKCFLPRDETAWQCDGCGYELTKDFEAARTKLRAQIATARLVFWVMLVVDVGIVGGSIYLFTQGWIVISVPLVLAAIGLTANAARRGSVLREHLSSLDRRHTSLPKATTVSG